MAALIFSLAGLLFGCASSVERYPTRSPEVLSATEERSALTVGAAPLVNGKESERYFGIDLEDAEIAAILVVVRNASIDVSYLLLEDRISIANASGAATRADRAPTSDRIATSTQVAGLALVGAGAAFPPLVLVGLPVFLAGVTMGSSGHDVQESLVTDALRSTTLSPGTQAQGFVYFARKDLPRSCEACVLTIELTRMEDGAVERFDLPISFKEVP